ncbi:MAG: hypothetical protein ABIS14_08230 [Sphingomonas sp.]
MPTPMAAIANLPLVTSLAGIPTTAVHSGIGINLAASESTVSGEVPVIAIGELNGIGGERPVRFQVMIGVSSRSFI